MHGTEVVFKCDGTYSSPGTTEFTRTCQNGNFAPSFTTDAISCLSGFIYKNDKLYIEKTSKNLF